MLVSVLLLVCLTSKVKTSNHSGAGNVFYEIAGSIFSYNNIWEYFCAVLWPGFNKCRVTLACIESRLYSTEPSESWGFFPHHILATFNYNGT